MAKEKEKPLTRKDVLKAIADNGGKTEGLDLSNQRFVEAIDLSDLDLSGIKLNNVRLFRVNFNGSNLDRAIMQKAYLGYATFNPVKSKFTSLQGVDLRGANLHDAEFREADLSGAQFQEEPGQLLPASLERTDFGGAVLFRTNFRGCYFYGTKLEGAYIRGADITIDTRLGDADWGNYKIGEEIGEGVKKDLYAAEHRYRHLKLWYNNSGYSDTAAKFYYREKEANRKSLKWCSWSSFRHRFTSEILRLLFGYGEDWKRVLYWMALVILGSAVAYLFGGLNPLYSLYFSVISFTALGYGKWVDITPEGWIQALGATESFLGVFMMALLLVTFFRKWTR